jgi:acyl-CoA thioesterase FadM
LFDGAVNAVVVVDDDVPAFSTDVFIEHTDAFQMMLNTHVPTFIERALMNRNENLKGRVTGIKTLKYKTPGRLGDTVDVTVHASKKHPGAFNAKVIANGAQAIAAATSVTFSASNTATQELPPPQQLAAPPSWDDAGKLFVSAFKLWPEEMPTQHQQLPISTATIFNLFERGRSNMLGGPRALAQSQSAAVHYYVARVTDYTLLPVSQPTGEDRLGAWAKVYTTVTLVGTQLLDFDQRITLLPAHSPHPLRPTAVASGYAYCVDTQAGAAGLRGNPETLLAQARFTIASVSAGSGEPCDVDERTRQLLR